MTICCFCITVEQYQVTWTIRAPHRPTLVVVFNFLTILIESVLFKVIISDSDIFHIFCPYIGPTLLKVALKSGRQLILVLFKNLGHFEYFSSGSYISCNFYESLPSALTHDEDFWFYINIFIFCSVPDTSFEGFVLCNWSYFNYNYSAWS